MPVSENPFNSFSFFSIQEYISFVNTGRFALRSYLVFSAF